MKMIYTIGMLCILIHCQQSIQHDHLQTDQHTTYLESAWRDYITLEKVTKLAEPIFMHTTGHVTFNEDLTQHVASPISGRITQVFVKLGDHVDVGAPLLELTSQDIALLQADLKKAKQDLQLATKAWARAQGLQVDGAVSSKEVAAAAADLKKAHADVDRSYAQLKVLDINPNDAVVRAVIKARIAGTVVERNVLAGQEVRTDGAAPLITITNLDDLWVIADFYEQDLGLVHVGSTIKVQVPAYVREDFMGVVSYIGDVVDSQTRTVKVRCRVPNKDNRLKPNMFADVYVEQHTPQDALFVSHKALIRDGQKSQVIVVHDNNMLEKRSVDLGSHMGNQQMILHGLKENETVVIDGAIFLNNKIKQ